MAGLPALVMVLMGIILLVPVGIVRAQWNSEHKVMEYYMSTRCGTTVTMGGNNLNDAIIHLNEVETYANNMDCELTVVTSEGQKLMFSFLGIEMDSCDDWVRLYGETTTLSDALTSELCATPASVVSTPGKTGILKFRSNSVGNSGNFKILITSFYTTVSGTCKAGFFNCGTSGRCINDDLKCNDRDNCGDSKKDEEGCEAKEKDDNEWMWRVLPGVCTSVVVFIVVVVVSCVLIHKKKKGMVGAPGCGQTRYPTVPPPAYQNQAYSQAYSNTTNTGNNPWFTQPETKNGFSSVGPPLAAFSYSQPQPATYNPPPSTT